MEQQNLNERPKRWAMQQDRHESQVSMDKGFKVVILTISLFVFSPFLAVRLTDHLTATMKCISHGFCQ